MARMFRGFGSLPDFTPNGTLLTTFVNQLSSAINKAKQDQTTIAPLLSRPEGSSLAATVTGLEGSIAAAWQQLVNDATLADNYNQARQAALAQPVPNQANFQYTNGGADWQRATQAYTANVNSKTQDASNATNNANASKLALADLLDQYNTKVLAAASLVQDTVDAELVAEAAKTKADAAANTKAAAITNTQALVANQQLQQLQVQAAAATAAVNDGTSSGPSPLLIAAIAVPVLGVIAWAVMRRKKSGGSVAGYRRRKRSRRSRR